MVITLAIFFACPVNIHIAEDEWMYLSADSMNDGLMNAAKVES
jgi:hypothetical protein